MLMQKNVVDVQKGLVLSLYFVWKQKYHIQKCSLKYKVVGTVCIYVPATAIWFGTVMYTCGKPTWFGLFGDLQGGVHQSEAHQYTSKVKIQYIHNLAVTLHCCKTLLLWDEHGDWRYWWKFWGQPLNFGQFIGQKYKMKFIAWSCTIRVTESRRLIIGRVCCINAEDKGIIKYLFQGCHWKRELGRESHNSKGIITGS